MSEEWRDSEAQVITRGRWTRLNGTDAEILIPEETASGTVTVNPGGGAGAAWAAGGAGGTFGGAGGSSSGALVIRVRRARSAGEPGSGES